MEDDILTDKVSKLPPILKLKVFEFIDCLLKENSEGIEEESKPVFGSGKGMFVMKPDFDEPLEDFKDYI